ncbi:MAG: hypothetical protein E6850_03310 [Leclercia adecarboxylata]|nr:hypothetical protein [Leclercia adecarboxylata]MDU1651516.1 hypothetical protein [Leclercia adecarboxylata]
MGSRILVWQKERYTFDACQRQFFFSSMSSEPADKVSQPNSVLWMLPGKIGLQVLFSD